MLNDGTSNKPRGKATRNSPECKPKARVGKMSNLGEPIYVTRPINQSRSVSSFQKLNMPTGKINYHTESNDNPMVSVSTNYDTPKKVSVIGKELTKKPMVDSIFGTQRS